MYFAKNYLYISRIFQSNIEKFAFPGKNWLDGPGLRAYHWAWKAPATESVKPMAESRSDLIHLLALAEAKASQLQRENEQLMHAFDDMLRAQEQEARQLAELSEQLWAAEDALAAAEADREQALAALHNMNGTITRIQQQVKSAQDAAHKGMDGLEIQARLYELETTVEVDPVDAMVSAYNNSLKADAGG